MGEWHLRRRVASLKWELSVVEVYLVNNSREWEWEGKGRDNIHAKFRGTRFLEGAGSNMWNCACTHVLFTRIWNTDVYRQYVLILASDLTSRQCVWLHSFMVTYVGARCVLILRRASPFTVFLACIDQNVWPWRERSPACTLDPSSVARFLVNVKWCAWQLASFKAIYTCWNMYRDTDILFLGFMKLRIGLEQSVHGETCICILPFLIKNILSLVLY